MRTRWRQDLWHQRSQIGKPIRLCVKHNDGDRERGEVLLKGEVSIDRNEHVELFLSKRQQLTILDGRPAHLMTVLAS